MNKVAVVGSRTYRDYNRVKEELDKLNIQLIISGGAPGADFLAQEYARHNGLPILIFYPDWRIGKSAGFVRNEKIVSNADIVIAFWDGKSKGTLDSINHAKRLNKQLIIVSDANSKQKGEV